MRLYATQVHASDFSSRLHSIKKVYVYTERNMVITILNQARTCGCDRSVGVFV